MRKNHLWYQMFRYPIVGAALRLFYRKIKVSGRENLPKNKPILFIPNHQNSFMDALLVVCTVRPFIYFLTRAEAFNPPILGWLLKTLNMLPIYRVRDGFSSVQKNNEIFELCFSYFKRNDAVLIFPEANHDLKRRIRPLSKGFTRIAFGAEVNNNWNMGLQVIPVGINYSEHRNCRNIIQVNYGKAIPVKDFEQEFKENENAATQHMKEMVSEAMKKLVFHVPDLKKYLVHKVLWDTLETNQYILTDAINVNERINKTDAFINEELISKANELSALAEKYSVKLKEVAHSKKPGARDILLLPFYGFSFLNNIIPYQPVRHLTTKVIKDHAFDASIKFLAGLFILPAFYALAALILCLAGVHPTFIWAYVALSFLTAPLFIRAKELFTSNSAQKLKKHNPDVYRDIREKLETFRKLRHSILNE